MAHRGRQSADDAVALALAAGKTASEAAEQAGVGVRTVTRRLADSAFRQRIGELRAEMTARALGKLADGMADAADKLRGLLNAESESVQLAAAKALLELGTKLRDSVEIEERLATLERREAHGPQPYSPAGAA